ncbi:MAG: hypothetical protein J6D26_04065 [Clostridia bacterium]|nr:hypothetical protein [Clostridia bacterium]
MLKSKMLKGKIQKVVSLLLALAVLCTFAAVPALAFEATDDPNVIYQRDYDNDADATKYIHNATTPDGTLSDTMTDSKISTVITEANGNKAHRIKGDKYHEFYFTKGVAAADGILHLSFKMKAINLISGTSNFSFMLQSDNIDEEVIKVFQKELRPFKSTSWQGHADSMYLAGYQDGTYDETTDKWTGGTAVITGNLTADDYNQVDMYFDLANERIGYAVNGVVKEHTFAEVNDGLGKTETLQAFGIRASSLTELYFDDIQATIVEEELYRAMQQDGYQIGEKYYLPATISSYSGGSVVNFQKTYTNGTVIAEFTYNNGNTGGTHHMGFVDGKGTFVSLFANYAGGAKIGESNNANGNGWQCASTNDLTSGQNYTIKLEVDLEEQQFRGFVDGTQMGTDWIELLNETTSAKNRSELATNGIGGFMIRGNNGTAISKVTGSNLKLKHIFGTRDNLELLDCSFTDTKNASTNQAAMLTGGNYRLRVATENANDTARSCYAIVAVYGADNYLISCVPHKVETAANTTKTERIDFSVPTDGSVTAVKAFIWDNLTDITPIITVVQ